MSVAVRACRSISIRGLVIAAAGLFAATAAHAAAPEGASLTSCAPELKSLCAGVEAGDGKKLHCLTDNQAKLSSSCAAAVQFHTGATRSVGVQMAQAAPGPAPAAKAPAAAAVPNKSGHISLRSCRADVATLCGPGDHPRAERITCLTTNRAKISPACAATLDLIAAEKDDARAACHADSAKLCGDAKGDARQACLVSHKSELSPLCAARVEKRAARGVKQVAPKQ